VMQACCPPGLSVASTADAIAGFYALYHTLCAENYCSLPFERCEAAHLPGWSVHRGTRREA
jgi:hypothetical protein